MKIDAESAELVQILDALWQEAERRSGAWLVCQAGCTQCCYGPFAISAWDAKRLRDGLAALERDEPARAARVRERSGRAVDQLSATFPGDAETGILSKTVEAEARFQEFANEMACPALDLGTGTCDLYAWRPVTCRTFGPPLQLGPEAIAVCELCYSDATDEQIAACAVAVDVESKESRLIEECEQERGYGGETIVAFCLGLA